MSHREPHSVRGERGAPGTRLCVALAAPGRPGGAWGLRGAGPGDCGGRGRGGAGGRPRSSRGVGLGRPLVVVWAGRLAEGQASLVPAPLPSLHLRPRRSSVLQRSRHLPGPHLSRSCTRTRLWGNLPLQGRPVLTSPSPNPSLAVGTPCICAGPRPRVLPARTALTALGT